MTETVHEVRQIENRHPRPPGEVLAAVWDSFQDAAAMSWPYMLIGILLGLLSSSASGALTTAASYAGHGSFQKSLTFFSDVVKHVADGFFVSSVAVLFYEWGSHARSALELSEKLQQLLASEAEAAIHRGMQTVFSDTPGLCEEHAAFVRILSDIARSNDFARGADIAFLTLFIHHAQEYGGQLRTLRAHLNDPRADVGRPFHLDFTKLDYADTILTTWMTLLGPNDSYDTISNPRTWSALKTGGFQKAGRAAVTKGAEMRRIFIMDRADDLYDSDDLRRLVAHYQFAANAQEQGDGSYLIDMANGNDFFPVLRIKPEDQHYGIFRFHPKEKPETSVAFKVVGAEVENFELVAVPNDGALRTNFEQIWRSLQKSDDGPLFIAKGQPSPTGPGRFLDAVVSRELRHLSKLHPQIRLDIVSTLASWARRYKLPELVKLLDVQPPNGSISVRHLFLTEDDVDVTKFGAQLTDPLLDRSKAAYEIRVLKRPAAERLQSWLHERWQFVGKDAVPLHSRLFTLECKNNLSDFFIDEMESAAFAVDYRNHFDRFWNSATIVP